MKALLPTEHILKLIPKQKQLCNQSTSIWGGGPSSHLGKYTWKLQRDGVMPSYFINIVPIQYLILPGFTYLPHRMSHAL